MKLLCHILFYLFCVSILNLKFCISLYIYSQFDFIILNHEFSICFHSNSEAFLKFIIIWHESKSKMRKFGKRVIIVKESEHITSFIRLQKFKLIHDFLKYLRTLCVSIWYFNLNNWFFKSLIYSSKVIGIEFFLCNVLPLSLIFVWRLRAGIRISIFLLINSRLSHHIDKF